MRRVSSILLALMVMAGVSSALAQQAPHHVTWSYDPASNTMQATPAASYVIEGALDPASSTAPTSTTYTGTIDITAKVKLLSTVPDGAFIRCSGAAGLEYQLQEQITTSSSVGSIGLLQSTESVDAIVSNGTATCTFSIPYSWTVPASTKTTTVTIQGITGSVGISEDVLNSVTGTKVIRVVRSITVGLTCPTTIPADGTTTTLTANTVL